MKVKMVGNIGEEGLEGGGRKMGNFWGDKMGWRRGEARGLAYV